MPRKRRAVCFLDFIRVLACLDSATAAPGGWATSTPPVISAVGGAPNRPTGGKSGSLVLKADLAEAMALTGDLDNARARLTRRSPKSDAPDRRNAFTPCQAGLRCGALHFANSWLRKLVGFDHRLSFPAHAGLLGVVFDVLDKAG
jgi:hypothetical protein